jgi:hypothetical protein
MIKLFPSRIVVQGVFYYLVALKGQFASEVTLWSNRAGITRLPL